MSEFIRNYQELSDATNIGELITRFPVRRSEEVSIAELCEKISKNQTVIIITGVSEQSLLDAAKILMQKIKLKSEVVNWFEFMKDVSAESMDKYCNKVIEVLEKNSTIAVCVGRFWNMNIRAAMLKTFDKVAEEMMCVYVEPQFAKIIQEIYDEAHEAWMTDPKKTDFDTIFERKQIEIQGVYDEAMNEQHTYKLGVDVYAKMTMMAV